MALRNSGPLGGRLAVVRVDGWSGSPPYWSVNSGAKCQGEPWSVHWMKIVGLTLPCAPATLPSRLRRRSWAALHVQCKTLRQVGTLPIPNQVSLTSENAY